MTCIVRILQVIGATQPVLYMYSFAPQRSQSRSRVTYTWGRRSRAWLGPKDHILSISSFLAEPLPMFSCGNSRNLVNKTWKLNCHLKRPEVPVQLESFLLNPLGCRREPEPWKRSFNAPNEWCWRQSSLNHCSWAFAQKDNYIFVWSIPKGDCVAMSAIPDPWPLSQQVDASPLFLLRPKSIGIHHRGLDCHRFAKCHTILASMPLTWSSKEPTYF